MESLIKVGEILEKEKIICKGGAFMFKLPKCQFCGNQTKLEIMEDSHGGSYDIVCSKCNKHQEIGLIKSWILIKFNKNKVQ